MYRLALTPEALSAAPDLDDAQAAVVAHAGGPLLVLAGPGTGKTTTLVESVVDRIDRRGAAPDSVLVLTFSRRAAADLRTRIAGRLGKTVVTPAAMTFHAFCYALVRRFADRLGLAGPVPESGSGPGAAYGSGVRLLTGPEQDFRVREVLQGSEEVGHDAWPTSLADAFETRAFAGQVRSVLAKARQLGMDPVDVLEAGEAAGREDWVRVGQFFEEYLDVLDAEGVLDYGELVHRSRILLADPEVVATLRSEIGAVFVDEYQDTDPAQVSLLQALAGDGRDVVAVGDPDQSIYAFRGAEARGILDFPRRFRTAAGEPAPVLALGTARRFGPALLAVSRNVARRLPVPPALPRDVFEAFRNPTPDGSAPRGRVEVITCSSPGAEAEHVADLLRTAHLRDGLAWSQMAVLVRSGRQTIPALTRALVAAGVPVEVAGDEIPLAADPAVRPLLLALRVATGGRQAGPEEAQLLLSSPLGGLDSMATRLLGRALRAAERAELGGLDMPRPSPELLAAALHDPDLLEACAPGPAVDAAVRLAALLRTCAGIVRSGGTAEEALWSLWSGTDWPDTLQRVAAGGGESSRRADRDLDAVCALFDVAARSEEISGLRGVSGFLAEVEGQQIPADTWREADLRGTGVRVLTAHRSKGLEWDLVVVASVQEGRWPDVRRRGSLLDADRLGRHGLAEPVPTAVRVAEERRLFYVACTRARSRLVVTAVAGTEGEGDQPSRFLDELGVPATPRPGRPRRPLTLAALVGELRRTSVDPDATPELRDQATLRLARLADAADAEGRPLVPAASPTTWWGMRALSEAGTPVVDPRKPVAMSGSQLGDVLACPRQWFLNRQASAGTTRNSAASFGSVVHVLAQHSAGVPLEPEQRSAYLESVWDQIAFDANWLSAVERAEAEDALDRFVVWQEARGHLELLGTEVPFRCEVDAGGRRVLLTGTADRVERERDGRVRIVDFKTGRTAPAAADVAVQDQLGVYQLAVAQGAFADVAGPGARPSGAELVYLRLPEKQTGFPQVFTQASLDDVPFPLRAGSEGDGPDPEAEGCATWVHQRLRDAAELIAAERFDARVGPACRWCAFKASCPTQAVGRQVVA
ncbi:ATP-dependent helicase [Microlunatus antarcticus]|uniref:DNA 3'-5' helicase n=1 Tax=Microlunatus antarcticus TaxID=53388 RepID=A0A7W5P7K9_9ACTN|nr:ATP-dependent DNA helicase [Microlunatus antarcticus]MBB3327608.1 superfamily I DNA/RNA helicase/RecB family exonuclease [Microlunatus antarcticus]